jgi:hypothetical protein
MVVEELLTEVGFYRTWVEFPFFSDHAPICLQLDLKPVFKNYPFKFNAHWLEETTFVDLVQRFGMIQVSFLKAMLSEESFGNYIHLNFKQRSGIRKKTKETKPDC